MYRWAFFLASLLCIALAYWLGQRALFAKESEPLDKPPEAPGSSVSLQLVSPPALIKPVEAEVPAADKKSAPPEPIEPGGMQQQGMLALWESTANMPWTVRDKPLTPPDWLVTGIVSRGPSTQIIVQINGEPAPRMIKLGESLPTGGTLAWVRPGAIGVATPEKTQVNVMAFEHLSPTETASKPAQ